MKVKGVGAQGNTHNCSDLWVFSTERFWEGTEDI